MILTAQSMRVILIVCINIRVNQSIKFFTIFKSYSFTFIPAHGTFIGTLRLEAHKPTILQLNSTFHFGASTRYYILRERPSAGSRSTNIMEDIPMNDSGEGALLGLPESQTDLDVCCA